MQPRQPTIHVSVREQKLILKEGNRTLKSYAVSTSCFGLGVEPESCRTPTGRFRICEKIGDDAPAGTVFRGRKPTGESGSEDNPEDLVQTRILWLDGLDEENRNTKDRYIYIHGTNHEADLGLPASHGCVRMANSDIIELYDQVTVGTEVVIES